MNVNLQNNPKENWEGFDYGTEAAAAGGVTTLVDHPCMKKPNMTSQKNLKKHIEDAQNKIKVDLAFLAYLTDSNLCKMKKLIESGVVFGFSSYLSAPLNRKLDEITEKGLL